ncbi:MAG: glycosyl hydrolase [Cytophagaceae bacterium]
MKKNLALTALLLSVVIAVLIIIKDNLKNSGSNDKPYAKFEPEDGKVILFAGQELEAIGGLKDYNDGYFDHFDKPAGFTMYTNFRPGDISFGHTYKGLDGLTTTDDWGDSFSNIQMQIDDDDFANSALAIGLELVNHEDSVAMGIHDDLIIKLGNWIKNLGSRPVFLRIGYEFDAPEWNFYEKEPYKKAFIRIRTMLDSMGVNNVAYVWQSKGFGSSKDELNEWYPGDEYVDWCAYSFFSRFKEAQPMLDFARERKKPVFIAEASPMIERDGESIRIDLSDTSSAKEAWNEWFVPFFETIEKNQDVIKAISYINCEWRAHRMWKQNSPFKDIDARIQKGTFVSEQWKKKTASPNYLKASPELFTILNSNNKK